MTEPIVLLKFNDKLIVKNQKEEKDIIISILKQEMELVANLKVPLVVDINFGNSWLEAK